jgi:hypothetical protein
MGEGFEGFEGLIFLIFKIDLGGECSENCVNQIFKNQENPNSYFLPPQFIPLYLFDKPTGEVMP